MINGVKRMIVGDAGSHRLEGSSPKRPKGTLWRTLGSGRASGQASTGANRGSRDLVDMAALAARLARVLAVERWRIPESGPAQQIWPQLSILARFGKGSLNDRTLEPRCCSCEQR